MSLADKEEVALSNCDREPVHIPGRIQPFGALLAFDVGSGKIQHHSENLVEMLGIGESDLLGLDYEHMLSNNSAVHGIRGALSLPTIRNQRDRLGVHEFGKSQFDLSVYATNKFAVVEFEPSNGQAKHQSPVAVVRSMMSSLQSGGGVIPLVDSATRALRHLTGHDRVMGYRFFENGDGEVIAEAKSPSVEPYLGLRYPAWDIPTQVRQVMLRAPFRIIEDIHSDQVGLIQSGVSEPLDLTHSHLRGISPIHVEYLTNMGVRATMNISLIVRGKLWGMFAFHHYRPRTLTPDERSMCELFGQLASMMVQQELERERLDRYQKTRSTVTSMALLGNEPEPILERLHQDVMRMLQADGLCLVRPDSFESFGTCPTQDVLRKLCSSAHDETVVIESLSSTIAAPHLRHVGKTAGLLMLKLPQESWLVFCRNEVIHELRWAGTKEKEVEVGPNGPRLTPRGSFAEYRESVRGRCNGWTEFDLQFANEIVRELWKLMNVGTAEQSKKLERTKQYQDLLIAELNHRVRNTLALVRSIARQTTSSSVSIEQYVEMLEQRIAALSKAHDLVGGSGLQWARIGDLVRAELKAFGFEERRVSIDGPPIAVRADVAPILALLFHEMTSNAAKYGALASADGGTLNVRWTEEAGGVAIEWIERFAVDISEPSRRGFGIALIERALPFECNGKASVAFEGKQLRIQFWLPAETIDRLAEQESAACFEPNQETQEELDLSSLNAALVVEDNMVLAMELERMMIDLGVKSVNVLPNAELAMKSLDSNAYDCAILDINLGASTSFELAKRLTEQRIAVVLASGYGSKYELPKALIGIPRLTKPIGRLDLVSAVLSVTGNSQA